MNECKKKGGCRKLKGWSWALEKPGALGPQGRVGRWVRPGRFKGRNGSAQEEYIKAVDPFFSHFTKSFSLFSPYALFSLLPIASSSPTRSGRR